MDAYLAWAKRQQGDETKASPAPGSLPGSAAKDASVLRTTPLKGRKKSLMPLSVQLPTRPNPGPVAALPGVPDTEIDPTRARVNVPLRGKSDGKLGVADSPAVRDHAGAGRALLMGSARERTESASGLWVDGRERSSWTSMSRSMVAGSRVPVPARRTDTPRTTSCLAFSPASHVLLHLPSLSTRFDGL